MKVRYDYGEGMNPSIQDIQRWTAEEFDVPFHSMRISYRPRRLAEPRMAGMYLAYIYSGFGFPTVAREFRKKTHVTAMHAFNRIKEIRDIDPIFNASVNRIEARIMAHIQARK